LEPDSFLPALLKRAKTSLAGHLHSVLDSAQSRLIRLRAAAWLAVWSGAAAFALFIAYTLALIPFTPSIADLRKAKVESPSILLSADGKELAVFKRMNREWVEMKDISPYVVQALIATEDHRFYEHHGIDLKRTAAGLLHTLRGDPEGGSTLTQQLARNLYPEEIGRKRTITRKLKELITAFKIEYAYSKPEILLTYLNTMPFLYNAFGIEMGARTYFDKSASELDILESATLVGMLKGTSYYNPVFNGERALQRRNVVLAQMVKRGGLSQAECDRLKRLPIRLDFERQPEPVGATPHFAAYVRKWLIDWADRNDYNLYADGLVIHSTIDARMQAAAEQAVNRQLQLLQGIANAAWGVNPWRPNARPAGSFWRERNDLLDALVRESAAYRSAVAAGTPPAQALARLEQDGAFLAALAADKMRVESGFVAMDPTSGAIKAWVGSRDFATDQFDHVAQARRQPGSTFKPFVYGTALEQGMSPDMRFKDTEVGIPLKNGSIWRPTDVTAPSEQLMTLGQALAYSKNTITAQVMQQAGPANVARFARRLGITQSPLEPVPSLALGTSPVTLLEMTTAYSTIASGGQWHRPLTVTQITDREGNVLETFDSPGTRALKEATAAELTEMMRGVINMGTGRAIRNQFGLRGDFAGKTGTTQDDTDAWFIMMHPQLVAGAWVGFNDARITLRRGDWGTGARAALPIVGNFYRKVVHDRGIDVQARFPAPPESLLMQWWHRARDWIGERWSAITTRTLARTSAPAPSHRPSKPAAKRAPAPEPMPGEAPALPPPVPTPAPMLEPVPAPVSAPARAPEAQPDQVPEDMVDQSPTTQMEFSPARE
jgi:penicillin-binding protein 1A